MRYLVVEHTLGIFLGDFGDMPLFSNILTLPVVKAYSFDTREIAEDYIKGFKEPQSFFVVEVDADEKYVNVVTLIKQGYSKYTAKMVDKLPMLSEEIH